MTTTGTALKTYAKGLSMMKRGFNTDARNRVDFDTVYKRFLDRCTRENIAQPTRDLYVHNLTKLFTYLRSKGGKYWQDVSLQDMKGFVEECQSSEASDHTKHQILRNLKTLLLWIRDDDECQSEGMDPHVKSLPKMKKLQGRVYLPSPHDLDKFVEAFDKDTIWGFRDYVVCHFILCCGARIGEVCNLTPDDIKWDVGMVRLFGKGKKERIVPVEDDELFPILKKWVNVREKYARGNGLERMFIGKNGGKCTPNTFTQAFNKHRTRTKIGKADDGTLTPHTLRHFFCTYYLIDGGNIEMLQRITGHTEIQTLMNYVHLANQLGAVKDNHTKVSPLKSLKRRVGTITEKKKRNVC